MTAAIDVPGDRAGNPTTPPRWRPDVQGLRAIAVLVVVLDHVGLAGFGGGFVGVDIFFVISGYVITGMLLRDTDRGPGTWFLEFYAKRARRIVPAATLVIVLTVVATFELTNFLRGAQVLPDATAAALFVANLHFIATGSDYARLGDDPSPLQHYWSLAVEEQFYLVWPLLVLLAVVLVRRVVRLRLPQVLVAVLTVVVVASYAHSILLTSADGTAAFYSPFTRAWELAIGALLAATEPSLTQRLSAVGAVLLGWLGAAAIVWSVVFLDDTTSFPGWIAAVPVLGTAALIVSGMRVVRGSPSALLSTRTPGYIGEISYSLYLVHWPIFTIAAIRLDDSFSVVTQALLVATAFLGAVLMYHAFEDPIRRSRFLVTRPWLSLSIVPISIALVFAVAWFERYRWDLAVPLVQQLF
ncbi:acyltransferase family protein [Rhodococcus gannanensis]|uniref:Acyltransferase family protein n=1 Tax=Rhodococcus gannanensis TaxID=1960308 RepID=A0ABW4P736_9NOCA